MRCLKKSILTPLARNQKYLHFNTINFLSNFRFISKLSRRHSDFLYTPCTHTCIVFPIINIPHQGGTFAKIDAPTLTHNFHPESIVYIKVHSWRWTFCGFVYIYNDMYPSLCQHTKQFHCTINMVCSAQSSPLHP